MSAPVLRTLSRQIQQSVTERDLAGTASLLTPLEDSNRQTRTTSEISRFTHHIENTFDQVRNGRLLFAQRSKSDDPPRGPSRGGVVPRGGTHHLKNSSHLEVVNGVVHNRAEGKPPFPLAKCSLAQSRTEWRL